MQDIDYVDGSKHISAIGKSICILSVAVYRIQALNHRITDSVLVISVPHYLVVSTLTVMGNKGSREMTTPCLVPKYYDAELKDEQSGEYPYKDIYIESGKDSTTPEINKNTREGT